jgi:hypothetical protein
MTIERRIGSLFGLDEEAWMRHANPLSVYTRNTALPLLVVALWARVWLGWWAAVPVALALVWIFVNPRIFSKPGSTDNWASKGVLGERVWLNRDRVPVPERHAVVPHLLNIVAAVGAVAVLWGTYALDVWPLALGFALVYAGKLWYLDRMVWLFEDQKELPEYRDWLY